MKKIIFVVLTIISVQIKAQSYDINYTEPEPKFYIGLQSGLESFAGLIGITADYRITGNFFIHAGAGLGSWGTKISGGIRNEKKSEKSFCYGIYLSRASGFSNFITQLETTTGTKDVTLDLYSGMTLNPTIGYKWVMRKRHRFFLEGGYAVPLQDSPWKVTDGSELTSISKQMLKILSPGGLSLGMGIQFAL